MSLINDALKRAQQVEDNKLPKGPMLRPVEHEEPPPSRVNLLLPVGLLVVGLLSFLIIWKLASLRADTLASTRMPEVRAVTPVQAPPVAAEPEAMEDDSQADEEPQPMEAAQTETEQPTPAPAVDQPAVQPAVVRQAPPLISSLKLQSIVFSKRPSAMISGMFLHEGDPVGDLRVKAIRRNQVELIGGGQTIVLTLY